MNLIKNAGKPEEREINQYLDKLGLNQAGISDNLVLKAIIKNEKKLISDVLTINHGKWMNPKDLEIFLIYDKNGNPLRYEDGRLVFEFRANCHDPERLHENIHYCVDVIIRSKDGKYLITKRADNKDTFPGAYEIIGGHLDLGDTIMGAVFREPLEEVGLQIANELTIDQKKTLDPSKTNKFKEGEVNQKYRYMVKDRQQHQIIDVYQINLTQEVKIKADDDEVVGYQWLEAKEILKELVLYLKTLEGLKTQDEIDNFKHRLIPEQVDTFIKLLEKNLGWDLSKLKRKLHIQLQKIGTEIVMM